MTQVTPPGTRAEPSDGGRRGWFARGRDAVVRAACRVAGCEHDAPAGADGRQLLQMTESPSATALSTPALGTAGRSGTPSVVVSNLTKVYSGGVIGASDISIEAHPGEIVAVLGPNGAGKSTILNTIVGLLRPTEGSVTVHGVPSTDVRRLGQLVGVALQSTALDESMTAREHFEVQAALYGMPRDLGVKCADALLEMFGLTAYVDRQVRHFSVGLQRRLTLALALVHDPPVIVSDEPTAGLDPQSRRFLWNLMEAARQEGRTILFSTQLLEEADMLAQRLYVVDGGQIVAQGPPAELRKAYGEHTVRVRVAGQLDEAAKLIAAELPEFGDGRQDNDALVFTSVGQRPDTSRLIEVLDRGDVDLLEVSVGRPSLEDAFVRLTGSSIRTEPLVNLGQTGGLQCRCQ